MSPAPPSPTSSPIPPLTSNATPLLKPAPTQETSTPHPNPFLERLILFLMPYFSVLSPSPDVARSEILATLASYGGRTRSEVINAARIIAFSFSAMDMLADTKTTEMSLSMRLRFSGCANNLSRSCQQNELNLAKRMAQDVPDAEPPAEPVNDVPDPEFEAAIYQAETNIAAHRARLQVPQSAPGAKSPTQPDENKRLWDVRCSTSSPRWACPFSPLPLARADRWRPRVPEA